MGIKNEQISRNPDSYRDTKEKYKSRDDSLRKTLGLSEINMPRAGLAQRFFHPFITLLMRTNVLSVFCHANALPHAF